MPDKKQSHRSRHGAHKGRYEAPSSFMDEGAMQGKVELQQRARIIFADWARVSVVMTKLASLSGSVNG